MRYTTLKRLRAREIVDLGGILVKKAPGKIQPGDLYVAERNTGPKFLTAMEVVMAACGCCISYIIPTTPDYGFDGDECVKVCEA